MTTKNTRRRFVLEEEEIKNDFDKYTHQLFVQCRFYREWVGGLPATKEGIEAFVEYQAQTRAQLSEKEKRQMVERLMDEELGEQKDITPELGEVDEGYVGQVNVLRVDEHGPWLGDWQIKAALKSTASRIGLWVAHRGLKGDMAEGGVVRAVGKSLWVPKGAKQEDYEHRVYVRAADGKSTPKLFWQTFQGRISGPSGATSIVTNSQCCEAGSVFEFVYMFIGDRLSDTDLHKIISYLGNTGFGSSRAMERGKAIITHAEMLDPVEPLRASAKEAKEEKKGKKAAA